MSSASLISYDTYSSTGMPSKCLINSNSKVAPAVNPSKVIMTTWSLFKSYNGIDKGAAVELDKIVFSQVVPPNNLVGPKKAVDLLTSLAV